ncbi:MAG: NAD(+) synthase [Desulfobacteraceae bacterium]|nr:MAG: NAD(+) synthase [Desulfobacteraceae bacterium]
MNFSLDVLKINPGEETEKVADFVLNEVKGIYRRRGVIVGLSGGVDSAVMAEIAVRAVGKENVIGLILPEKESNPVSSQYAAMHAKTLGIEFKEIDITPTVDSVCNYQWRDDYIRKLVPDYSPECKYNITLPTDLLDRSAYTFYVLQVQLPNGTVKKKRLNFEAFRTITAFASIKIRSRMIHLYREAEYRDLIVAGTTNRTELILGDFCKYGDGGTDLEALAHLYKNQIYQLADYLCVVPEIIDREPSPDTFSLPVSDQEFYFRIPFDKLDLLLYAWEHHVPIDETAKVVGITTDAVERVFRDFSAKNRATAHLREMPHTLR